VIILLDYDNVDSLERSHGLVNLITRILNVIGLTHLAGETHITVRLYGGWFLGSALSRSAQSLAPEIRGSFPCAITVSDKVSAITVIVKSEFALTLMCDIGNALTHTYRLRGLPQNLTCAPSPYPGCASPASCSISTLYGFISTGQCPMHGCTVSRESLLTKPEQKLVDTMLTVDLVHLATTSKERIVVVSTDDDVWPGLRFALINGAYIVHVHPVAGRTTPYQYRALATRTYAQASF
jgi:hypothetical protein